MCLTLLEHVVRGHSVCPSVCPSVALVSFTYTVQDIEIQLVPYWQLAAGAVWFTNTYQDTEVHN